VRLVLGLLYGINRNINYQKLGLFLYHFTYNIFILAIPLEGRTTLKSWRPQETGFLNLPRFRAELPFRIPEGKIDDKSLDSKHRKEVSK
jgi:hypothetical protein